MENSVKLWVQKIQGTPLASLALVRDFDYLKKFLSRLQPSFFKLDYTSYEQLIESIVDYYRRQQKLDISSSMKTAKKDSDHLKIWILVLGIAIRCLERNENIQLILNLDQKTQSSLMIFISHIDDTLASCPSLQMEASSRKQNTNLEKHLLDTIDQLSQQNSQLKTKLEQLEDQFNTYKTNKDSVIQELQQQLMQIHTEREDVLNQFQGVYNTDNIYLIVKAIENQNTLLKENIDKREEATEDIQQEKQQLSKKLNKLTEENTKMKILASSIEMMQGKIDQQYEQISELRKTENHLLETIFKLEKGQSPTKFQRRGMNRSNTFQPIPEQDEINIRESQSYKPPLVSVRTPSKYSQRLIRSIRKKGSTVTQQLQPYQRQRQHLDLIKIQQQKIQSLNKQIQALNEELQLKNSEVKYSGDRCKEIQDKLKHAQVLNELYTRNIKDKELSIADKNEEYEYRFGQLMEEIESLKNIAQENSTNAKKLETQSKERQQETSNKYEQKLKSIMDMLESELISFRNKELQYLETIRQLKIKGNIDLMGSGAFDVRKSAFVMERSHLSQTPEQTEDANILEQPNIKNSQISHKLSKKQSKISKTSVQESKLNLKIKQLQQEISILKKGNSQIQVKLSLSLDKQKTLLINIGELQEQILKLRESLGDTRQKLLTYLQEYIQKLKNQKKKLNGIGSSQNPNEIDKQLQKKIQGLQLLSEQILELKSKREQNALEIQTQKQKVIIFLKGQLQQMIKQEPKIQKVGLIQSAGQRQQLNSESALKLNKVAYDKYADILRELKEKQQENSKIQSENIKISDELSQLRQTMLTLQQQNNGLRMKITAIEVKIGAQSTNSKEYYIEVSNLVQEIQKHREHQKHKDDIIQQLQIKIKSGQQKVGDEKNIDSRDLGSAFKQRNYKLTRQLQKQTHCFALFRNKYKQLLNKHLWLEQEHRLMMSTFADLIIGVNS